MAYILLITSAVLLALNFAVNKVYQIWEGDSLRSSLKFNTLLGLFTGVIFFFINGCRIEINSYSLIMGALTTLFSTLYLMLSFSIMKGAFLCAIRSIQLMIYDPFYNLYSLSIA